MSGLRELIQTKCYEKMIEAETHRLEREKKLLKELDSQKEKDYNEKVANLIMGTGNVPSVVGRTNEPDKRMNYDFVSFKKIEKKHPIEYINPDKIDYIIHNPNKDKCKLKEDMPVSFMEIKEGEVEKGKEWYLKRDPKLPDGIASLLARYNWGDLKYMPNKKQYKNAQKKLKKKGGDILTGLVVKKGTILVKFD
jgi:hypothetical protein